MLFTGGQTVKASCGVYFCSNVDNQDILAIPDIKNVPIKLTIYTKSLITIA